MKESVIENRCSLDEQLAAVEPERHETQAQYLGRIAMMAEELGDRTITDSELDYVRQILPEWRFSKPAQTNRYGGRADQLSPVTPEQESALREYRIPNERLFALDGEPRHIAVITKAAFRASDIACILKVEAVRRDHASSLAKPLPQPNARENRNGKKPETPKLDEASGLLITKTERTSVGLMSLPVTQAAGRQATEVSAINKRVTFAIERNEIDRAEFLRRAVRGKLIDMSLLPEPREHKLTDLELRALREFPFAKLADLARGLHLQSTDEASQIRKSIAKKFGVTVRNQTLAYLVGIRDGFIED